MTGRTSSETDIRPLFTQRDIQAMSKAFNLASHDDVEGEFDRHLRPYSRDRRRG